METVMSPMTMHDRRTATDTVLRPLNVDEVDLALRWYEEIIAVRPATVEERRLYGVLWAQHCALFAVGLQIALIDQRKEDRGRIIERAADNDVRAQDGAESEAGVG